MGAGHIRLYDLFRKELNLPDDKAAAFVLAVEDVCGVESETRMQFVATKSDLERLENDCRMQFAAVREDLDQFKTETRMQFAAIKGDLNFKIERSKNDIYKAIFLGGIAQFVAIIAAVLAIVKFIK
jgi:hypothetical protein